MGTRSKLSGVVPVVMHGALTTGSHTISHMTCGIIYEVNGLHML
jgi:hypothetical protein